MEYTNSRITEIINEYIHSKRDRGIMTERLTNRTTLEEIAEMYAIDVSTVKRVIKKCSEEIFRHFPP